MPDYELNDPELGTLQTLDDNVLLYVVGDFVGEDGFTKPLPVGDLKNYLLAGYVATLADLGITATATELNYCDGATSNIQTQINGKANSSHTHTKEDITDFDDGDYATAAQGTLADSALQSADIGTIAAQDADNVAITGGSVAGLSSFNLSDVDGAITLTDTTMDVTAETFTISADNLFIQSSADLLLESEGGDVFLQSPNAFDLHINGIIWPKLTASPDNGDILVYTDGVLGFSGNYATSAQGALADSALQSGDNVSLLTNNAGYITSAPVDSVNGATGVVVLDADDIDDSATTNKFVSAGEITLIGAALQPGDIGVSVQAYSSHLAAIAGLSKTDGNFIVANGTTFVAESGATALASLGITASVTELNYTTNLTSDAQTQIDGKANSSHTHVKADITDFDDGDYATAAQGALADSALQSGDIGVSVQAYSSHLAAIAGLSKTDGNIIVANGTTFVAESGVTARASLGLAIGTNVQAYNARLADISASATTDGGFLVGNGTTFVLETGATALASLGITASATELNYCDGGTSNFQAQIDALSSDGLSGYDSSDGNFLVGTGAGFTTESGATALASLGITAGATALNYCANLTSDAQAQFDAIDSSETTVETGITASTTQTQGQQPLTANINVVSTVSNNNDVVTLDSAAEGLTQTIINNGFNILQIFPASGDKIDVKAINASITLGPLASVQLIAVDGTQWKSVYSLRAMTTPNDTGGAFVDDGASRIAQFFDDRRITYGWGAGIVIGAEQDAIVLGRRSVTFAATVDGCIFIGNDIEDDTTDDFVDVIAIGHGISVPDSTNNSIGIGDSITADNQVVLGNSSITETVLRGTITLAGTGVIQTIDATSGSNSNLVEIATGDGGDSASTNGGNSGSLSITGGSGGDATAGSGNGGNGGSIFIRAGQAGSSSGGNYGNGGIVSIVGGGDSSGNNPGHVRITAEETGNNYLFVKTDRVTLSDNLNLLVGGDTNPTDADSVIALFSNTAPSAVASDSIALYSSDVSAGNTTLALWTEGTPVTSVSPTSPNRTVALSINGELIYFHGKTTND